MNFFLSVFFFFVNFPPALYYLNAWNRLVRRGQRSLVLELVVLSDPIRVRHFSFFLRKALTVGLADSFKKPVSMGLK